MQKQAPKLVIMAAGMGSRFGGLKQMEPVDREGHSIIDFSMYDARRAGFRDLVFIIKREHEALFRERIGTRMERFFHVEYVYQELTDIPAGYSVPDGRVKPWGTGQAVACCRNVLHGPSRSSTPTISTAARRSARSMSFCARTTMSTATPWSATGCATP